MLLQEIQTKVKWAIDGNTDKAQNITRKFLDDPEFTVVWVDIKKLFDITSDFQKLDVSGEDDTNRIKGRVERAVDHWENPEWQHPTRPEIKVHHGSFMDPALVGFDANGINNVVFTDGRHRLAAAYKLGARTAPVIIDKKSAKKLIQLAG